MIGRSSFFPAALVKRVALAWLAISALLLLVNGPAIAAHRFPDPDDMLRLEQVRALIGGQGWFDLHAHRVDPLDGGVLMHWSRLVDVPIAAAILALRPLLGRDGAELVALVLVPLLTLGATLLLAARVAWERLGREASLLCCLVMAMSVPVVQQMRPMRIDHHGWQVVCACLALNGLMTRRGRFGGWVAGGALALGLSISLEGLPLTAVFTAVGAWRWVRQKNGNGERGWLIHFAQALTGVSILSFLATRGLADTAVHCDAISPLHLAVFAFGAVALTGLGKVRALPLAGLLLGFATIAAGALAMFVTAAPQCTGGSFNELDPVVRALWYDQIAEGLPIWKQDLPTALQIAVPGLLGLFAAWRLARRRDNNAERVWAEERIWWQEYGLLLAGALAIAVLVARAGAVSGAFAAVPLAWQLERWLLALRRGAPAARVPALAGVALAMVPSLPLTLRDAIGPANAGPQTEARHSPTAATHTSACDIRHQAPALLGQAGNILAPLDIGPELLLDTNDTVLATGHHRGARAMREVIDAFTADDTTAHAIVRRRQITYVALCPDIIEPALYAKTAPDGLAAKLLAGKAPRWLRRAGAGDDGRLEVWQVVD